MDKTRCAPLAGQMFKLGHTAEFGETLRDWLGSVEPMAGHAEVEALKAAMNAIEDPDRRNEVKRSFVAEFGRPERLTADLVGKANGWLEGQA